MKEKMTFESANAELQALVDKMQSGDLPLQESMECYRQASELLSFCYSELNKCKLKITDINEKIEQIKREGELFDD